MVFFTAYHIAYGSLGGAMTQNTDDRGSLYGYRLGTSQLLFWLMTVLWLPLINLLMSGGMAQDKAYFTAAIIFTVPGLLFAVLLYRNSREVVEPQKSTKLPAKDLWHFVIQNGPLLMVMFGQVRLRYLHVRPQRRHDVLLHLLCWQHQPLYDL